MKWVQKPEGRYNRLHIIESVGAVGGAADQARSLRHARISAEIMTGLRQ